MRALQLDCWCGRCINNKCVHLTPIHLRSVDIYLYFIYRCGHLLCKKKHFCGRIEDSI